MNDVNLIPKKEAIAYLESDIPRDSDEAETTRILIELIELGLVESVYDDGYVAYQAIEMDPFKAFVTIFSTMSEQEIKTKLPALRKLAEECKEELKTPFKKGTISEPIIESLKVFSNLNSFESKIVRADILEKHLKKEYLKYRPLKEIFSKILEYFSILSEHETRTSSTNINEKIMEIKKLLEEEERKIMEEERWKNQFIELFERVPNNSVPELKRALSEVRKQLEEK